MNLLEFVQSVPHVLSTIAIDESSLSVLAMLAGIIGGWTITGLRREPKAKKVKVERKPGARPRDPE